jgi:hypothetical protein
VNGADGNETPLDSELVSREVEAFIDSLTREPHALEFTFANK